MNFDLGPYGMYIWPSYAISVAGLIGITLWSVIGWYKARAVLARLEKPGLEQK
jgi:heme exporter protein CcmD